MTIEEMSQKLDEMYDLIDERVSEGMSHEEEAGLYAKLLDETADMLTEALRLLKVKDVCN